MNLTKLKKKSDRQRRQSRTPLSSFPGPKPRRGKLALLRPAEPSRASSNSSADWRGIYLAETVRLDGVASLILQYFTLWYSEYVTFLVQLQAAVSCFSCLRNSPPLGSSTFMPAISCRVFPKLMTHLYEDFFLFFPLNSWNDAIIVIFLLPSEHIKWGFFGGTHDWRFVRNSTQWRI